MSSETPKVAHVTGRKNSVQEQPLAAKVFAGI